MRELEYVSSFWNLKKKPFTISLIEDNQFYLRGIAQHIKNAIPNIKLTAFSRSSSFLTSLRHKPEIAIVDFNLDDRSDMEGIELIRELKFKSPNTKIIVLTGEQSISTAVKCLNEGVMDYVIKEDKAIDKIADEIKQVMSELLKEMHRDVVNRRIRFAISVVTISILGLLAYKLILPGLFE